MKTPAEKRLSHSGPSRKLDRNRCVRYALENMQKKGHFSGLIFMHVEPEGVNFLYFIL